MRSGGVRLRHLAEVNPATPEFDRIADDAPITFLPLEAVWRGALDTTRVRPKAEVSSGYTRFRTGDILIPKITPTFQADRSVIATNLLGGVGAGTTELHVVRPGPEVDPRYLYYSIGSRPFLLEGEGSMVGVAGQKRVPDEFVRDYAVVLEPLERQRAIADYLDRQTVQIDSLVSAKRRLMTSVLARQDAFVDALVSSRPDASRRADVSWLSRVPEHWPSVSLGLIADVFNGSTPERKDGAGEIPWTTSGEIDQELVTEPTGYVSRGAALARGLRVAPAGSILVGLVGQGRTRGLCATLGIPSTLNQNVAAIVPRDSRLDSRYLAILLRLAYDDLRNGGRGGNQAALNCELLQAYRIPLAPIGEQHEVIMRVEGERTRDASLRSELARSVDLLLERRQALITVAVTGQLAIPGAAA